mmetsp:Transcript_106346/g.297728  ORF Transcript_106346/g.297728 Transcript_106346/m.297728 type:complete len:269 (+) Transcript_106346:622-1428(+)
MRECHRLRGERSDGGLRMGVAHPRQRGVNGEVGQPSPQGLGQVRRRGRVREQPVAIALHAAVRGDRAAELVAPVAQGGAAAGCGEAPALEDALRGRRVGDRAQAAVPVEVCLPIGGCGAHGLPRKEPEVEVETDERPITGDLRHPRRQRLRQDDGGVEPHAAPRRHDLQAHQVRELLHRQRLPTVRQRAHVEVLRERVPRHELDVPARGEAGPSREGLLHELRPRAFPESVEGPRHAPVRECVAGTDKHMAHETGNAHSEHAARGPPP